MAGLVAKRWWPSAAALAVGLLVGFFGDPTISGALASVAGKTKITQAIESCGMTRDANAVVRDGGHTLIIDASDSSAGSLGATECVLSELHASAATVVRVERTRLIDGRQSAAWDGLVASWGYSPSSGLNMTIESK